MTEHSGTLTALPEDKVTSVLGDPTPWLASIDTCTHVVYIYAISYTNIFR